MTTPQQPFVSVVMPVRNEQAHIREALGAVLRQDYPADRMEVVVVDGASDDDTLQRIDETVAGADTGSGTVPAVRVLHNPRRIVPVSLNMAIAAARGDVIARVDGHCVVEPGYLRTCVETLERTGADCVGGLAEAAGDGLVAGAIAVALSTAFGVGGSRFRHSRTAGPATTVFLPAYRRQVFERIGGFDASFVRTQDSELHFRLIRSGSTIWFTPNIKATYFGRRTLRSLARQYFQYGVYKQRLARKHGALPSMHQLAAPALVAALVAGAAASLFVPVAGLVVPGVYLAANLAFSVKAASRGWRHVAVLPAAYAVMHLSWGAGFLAGLAGLGARTVPEPDERLDPVPGE